MFIRHDSIQELPGAPQHASFPTSPQTSMFGVEMMFAMSGGIAGDGVFGLKGDAGTVGAGVLSQASRN
jgi:hypothetical protein